MSRKDPKRTLTQIQTEYVETVMHAKAKWAHRKGGGQSWRTIRAAAKRFRIEMAAWGYNAIFIEGALQDAKDVLALEEAAV